jgi:uncharacterized protein YfeS
MDRFYHFGDNPDSGKYGRILENAYIKNHSYFLDFITRDGQSRPSPVLEALWHHQYCDLDMKLKRVDDNKFFVLQNEAIL